MPQPFTIVLSALLKERAENGKKRAPKAYRRPKTRADCAEVQRPCPFVACRHHLFLEARPSGDIAFPFGQDLAALDTMRHTCSLDVADQGEMPLDDVGKIFDLSHQGVRLLYWKAMTNFGTNEEVRRIAAETDSCEQPEALDAPKAQPKAVRKQKRSGRHLKEMMRER